MEKSGKRGKIPQSDWPLIMGRYEAGETLASIARTYDCSPPAISYIVSRSRAKSPAAEMAPPLSEPQLIKAQAGESVPAAPTIGIATNGAASNGALENGAGNAGAPQSAPVAAPPPAAASPQIERLAEPRPNSGPLFERRGDDRPRDGNGLMRNGFGDRQPATLGRPIQPRPNPQPPAAVAQNGDNRRTLHLSLGGNGSNGNGGAPEHHSPGNGSGNGSGNGGAIPDRPQQNSQNQPPYQPYSQQAGERYEPRAASAPPRPTGQHEQPRYGFPPAGGSERQFAESAGRPDASRRKDTGTFIDQELRTRVDGDIAAFLAAFDAALGDDTQDTRAALREATDRLLRAGARTRIELERLEARVPLPPRDTDGRVEPAWRQR